jgi:hypothetical protein
MIIGIDPGWGGAIGIYTNNKESLVFDCPESPLAMHNLILKHMGQDRNFCCIERVHASPQFGAIGNFRLGENFGAWQTILSVLEISYETCTPGIWQKTTSHEEGTTTKAKAWNFARKKFPTLSNLLGDKMPSKTSRGAGRADALCILAYAIDRNKEIE